MFQYTEQETSAHRGRLFKISSSLRTFSILFLFLWGLQYYITSAGIIECASEGLRNNICVRNCQHKLSKECQNGKYSMYPKILQFQYQQVYLIYRFCYQDNCFPITIAFLIQYIRILYLILFPHKQSQRQIPLILMRLCGTTQFIIYHNGLEKRRGSSFYLKVKIIYTPS